MLELVPIKRNYNIISDKFNAVRVYAEVKLSFPNHNDNDDIFMTYLTILSVSVTPITERRIIGLSTSLSHNHHHHHDSTALCWALAAFQFLDPIHSQ
jgi:hypothetical protein